MSQAEVYVYEDDKMIQGFVGLSNEYIEGIFVSDGMQSPACDSHFSSEIIFTFQSTVPPCLFSGIEIT